MAPLLVALTLAACTHESDTKDTAPAGAPPCSAGWGAISDPDAAIHVRGDGDDSAAGTAGAPLATVEAALDLSRTEDRHTIALGPGTWATNVVLDGLSDDATGDDGLAIEGCGVGETTLTALSATAAVVQASGVDGLVLAGLTLDGGRRTLRIDQGGTADLDGLEVSGGSRAGVVMDGSYVRLTVQATDLHVHDISEDSGALGYGILVQDATATLTDTRVVGATGVGVFVTGANAALTATALDVVATVPTSDATLGRGVHVQELASASLSGATLTGNADAGAYALRALAFELTSSLIEATSAGTTGDDATGDGVVVTQGLEPVYAPSTFTAVLSDTTVTSSARAGVLLDAVTAEVSGNSVTGNGYADDGVLSQNGADTSASTDTITELTAPLATLTTSLAVDDLAR